jgi:hypothetical protein
MPKRIEHIAAGKHMTLDEIAAFIADARAAGAAGTAVPHGRLSLGGRLLRLDIAVEQRDDAR